MHGPGSGRTGICPSKASCVWISISSPLRHLDDRRDALVPAVVSHKLNDERVRVETRLKGYRSDAWPAVWVSARFCGMVAGPATSWTMKVPMDGGRDRGFEASRGPAERIIGPRPARRKCDGRIFRRDGGRIVDAGMVAGTCHKPDDGRSLWTVVVIGVLEPREGPAEKKWSRTGRPKMRWSHFPPRWRAHRRCGDGRR